MEADKSFFKFAAVETFLPEDTISQVSDLLQDESALEDSISHRLLPVKKRDLLFFDEKVRAFAVLRVPQCDEDSLKSYLSRIEFNIEVWAIDRPNKESQTTGTGSQGDTVRDLINSTSVKDLDDPIVLAQEGDRELGEHDFLTLVWDVELALSRPKIRIPDASIFLHSLVLVSPPKASDDHADEAFLPPFEPMEANVLESMQHIRGFQDNPPYLAASRLERVLPKTPAPSKKFRIENMSPKYTIVPAAIARMRFSTNNLSSPSPTTIALLDVDLVPFVEVNGTIELADIAMANGRVENLMPNFLPAKCASRDSLTFVYSLHSIADQLGPPAPQAGPLNLMTMTKNDVLSISLHIRLHISATCEPIIVMEWTTTFEPSQTLTPSFGPPSQKNQLQNRLSSLPLANNPERSSQRVQTNLQPSNSTTSLPGVTISFTAPSRPALVGKPFSWSVLITNRSSRPTSLAIIPLPRIPRQSHSKAAHIARKHAPRSSNASLQPSERRHTASSSSAEIDIAQAVVDENVIYALQQHTGQPPTDLLSLTAELRVGPLEPGQCHESSIEMVAFEKGTLRMDLVRVVDLMRDGGTGVGGGPDGITDLRDLPDVVVVEG